MRGEKELHLDIMTQQKQQNYIIMYFEPRRFEEEEGNLDILSAKIREHYKLTDTMMFPEIRKTEQMASYRILRGPKWTQGEAFRYTV